MSTEERIVALEQGLAGIQREFFVHLSENNRHMVTLNKVITQQEINSRDVDHNLAMLLGVASEQGKSIRVVKDDMDLRFDVVDQQMLEVKQYIDEARREVNEVKQSMEARFDQVLQLLSTLTTKPDQEI